MTEEFLMILAIGFSGANGGRRARHGVWRRLNLGDADDRRAAGAGERAGAHRRSLHHRRVRRLAYLSSQRGLAAGDPAWHRRRARRGARRLGAVEYRCEGHAAVCVRLSAGHGDLHPDESGAHSDAARCAGGMDCAGRLRRRISRRQRWRRLGSGRDDDAGRFRPRAAPDGGFGQCHRISCDDRGRHHVLRRTRRVAAAEPGAAGDRRADRRAVRRLGGEIRSGANADDRRRRADPLPVVVADFYVGAGRCYERVSPPAARACRRPAAPTS